MDRSGQPTPPGQQPQGEPDYAPTAEFKAFLEGDPVPTDADDRPGRRAADSEGFLDRLRSLWQRRDRPGR
jgi:hypothetical protein